jgi:predicted dehydrogenase
MPALARLGWNATVLDTDLQRAQSLARRYRRASPASGPVAANTPDSYDIVVVATPLGAHHEVTTAALEAGAHTVLVEKPPFAAKSELESALVAARSASARLLASFHTRAWPPIQGARRLFPEWRDHFGPLLRVLVARGGPWSWSSVAAREGGAEGLQSLLLEELPHPLDSVFYVTGWRDVAVEIGPDPPRETPWTFVGSAFVTSHDDGRVLLGIRGSRTEVLANAVIFEFERGAVSVELSPTGGVIVQRNGDCRLEVMGIRAAPDVRDVFAGLLAGAVGREPGAAPPPVQVAEWADPLSVVEVLQGNLAGAEQKEAAE